MKIKLKNYTSKLLTLFAFLAFNWNAFSAEPSDISEGRRLFMQKGNCQGCHGWAGDGRKMDNQMPDGANLRAMNLDRATLIMFVKCGVPGSGMPAFDRFAYSDGRCYGKKSSDLRSEGIHLVDPPATLQPREIELLADFVLEKIINKGPITKSQCLAYWDSDAQPCQDLK